MIRRLLKRRRRREAMRREALRLAANREWMDRYIAMTADMVKPKPEMAMADIVHDAPLQTVKLGKMAVFRVSKSDPLVIVM